MGDRDHMNNNRTIDAGDDKCLVFNVVDRDGNAVNVNGFTPEWKMFSLVTGADILAKAGPGEAEVTDATAGEITVTLDVADTETLQGTFRHQLDVIDVLTKRATVSGGLITIEPKRT